VTSQVTDRIATLTAARLAFVYAACYALFDLLPVAFSDADAFKRLTWGDVVDAPLVVLPLGLTFLMARDAGLWRNVLLRGVLLLGLLGFAQGHAVHMTANAISHNITRTDEAARTTHFLDEHVGHYEQHVALLGLAALFILFGGRSERPRRTEPALLGFAAVGYGALLAGGSIEGQVVPLVLPASVALVLLGLVRTVWRRSEYGTFFSVSYAACFVGLVAYGLIHHGWPEILH
jgi:hypothetical protein